MTPNPEKCRRWEEDIEPKVNMIANALAVQIMLFGLWLAAAAGKIPIVNHGFRWYW